MINRLFFVGKYTGPDNRLNRNRFKHLYVRTVFVPGNVRWFGVVSFFESVEECVRYSKQLEDIKNAIDGLNQERSGTRNGTVVYASKLEYEWIPMVNRFIEEWGTEMVPQDVRDSADHVAGFVDLPTYVWPGNVEVPSDVVEEVSLFTPPHNDTLDAIEEVSSFAPPYIGALEYHGLPSDESTPE